MRADHVGAVNWKPVAVLAAMLGAAACNKSTDPTVELVLGGEAGTPRSISQGLREGTPGVTLVPFTLTNAGTCDLRCDVDVTTANGGGWLAVRSGAWDAGSRPPLAAGASITVEAAFDVATPALRPGTYTGSIEVSGSCALTNRPAQGSPATISVNLTVSPNNATITLSNDTITKDAVTLTDTWTTVPKRTLGDPAHPKAVWTGYEVLIFTRDRDDHGIAMGHRFDPATDVWTTLSSVGEPSERQGHTAIWTGSKMIIWGGTYSSHLSTGALYDPALDSWTAMSTVGAPTRSFHTAVWTGSRMLIWGGELVANGRTNEGAAYDPATDTWSTISKVDAPFARMGHTAVWTGREMIVWGGTSYQHESTGGAYNPATDTWRVLSTTDAPSGRTKHTAVWTGREMIVWGGSAFAGPLRDGASYDPVRDRWTALPEAPAAVEAREEHCAVWTGSQMILWGEKPVGTVFTPSTGLYQPISTTGVPGNTRLTSCLWMGTGMIVVGGLDSIGFQDTGGIYQ